MAQLKPPRRTTPRTEHQVGNYRFVRLIGEGGMGQVYEVKHVELGRRAALKMLRPDIARQEEMAARFFTEARAMSLVEHPALTHVYEYGHLDDGGAYIVMEYVEGESLRELLIKRGGKLPVLAALSWVRQVAAALHAAHDKGVVHRDLKPENIMLVSTEDTSVDSRIKILDFGIAKTFDLSPEAGPLLTRPGQMIGTPTYMAPEQADAPGKIGGHTDVYALGVLLFEILSGRLPFTGDDAIEVVGKHMFSAPPRLRDVMPEADPELDGLIFRMLAKATHSRPTMREVRAQLGKLCKRLGEPQGQVSAEIEDPSQAETLVLRKSKLPPTSIPTQFISTRLTILRSKPLPIAIGILLLGFLGLGIWLVLSSAPSPPAPGAPTTTAPNRKPAPSAKQLDNASVLDGKKAPTGVQRPLPDDSDKSGGSKRRPPRTPLAPRGSASASSPDKQPDLTPKQKDDVPRLVD